MQEHIINVDSKKCIGCSLCKNDCPKNNIEIVDKKAIIKTQTCIKCGHCVAICPNGSVSMSGYDDEPIEFSKKTAIDNEQLLNAIKSRRTIRQFKDTPVSTDIISQIIEAGRFTPSAKNSQAVSYIILDKDKDRFEAIAFRFLKRLMVFLKLFKVIKEDDYNTINEKFFFKNAPVAIVVISKDTVSGALASSNMALVAESFGLGVLYSGFFTKAVNISGSLRKALGLKRKDKAVATLVLGYPAVKYHRTAPKESAKVRFL